LKAGTNRDKTKLLLASISGLRVGEARQLNHDDTKSTKEKGKSNDRPARSYGFGANTFFVSFVSSWFNPICQRLASDR
jgi:hypothetical protein